jgi:hypothetical protein
MPKVLLAESLAKKVALDYPDVQFVEASRFAWHAGKRQVSYQTSGKQHELALLHELGHALLGHAAYTHDIALVQLELAAWEKARALAKDYGVMFDEDYVQDCLDTYRDWLHLRATCPTCFGRSLQANIQQYHCFNCQTEWNVSRSRLCRPYRLKTS